MDGKSATLKAECREMGGMAYFDMAVSSVAVVVEAVPGLRWRDSCRRFDTPLSLLKDELDLESLWLLEKLLLEVSNRLLNMFAASPVGSGDAECVASMHGVEEEGRRQSERIKYRHRGKNDRKTQSRGKWQMCLTGFHGVCRRK